jgi:hypothetical protein
MNRRIWGVALLVLGALAPASARADEKDQLRGSEGGWVALFNGKDLEGWEAYDRQGKQSDPSTNWVVKDGVIQGTGEVSHLFSPKGGYKNFRYRVEIKINDGGNSGMYVRTAKGPGFPKGYEIQVNSTHRDPVRTGSLYNMVLIKRQLVPPDTWFTQEVEARGNHITVSVNGQTLYECVDANNTYTEGHFAFQQHNQGSEVSIRKVEVMELP